VGANTPELAVPCRCDDRVWCPTQHLRLNAGLGGGWLGLIAPLKPLLTLADREGGTTACDADQLVPGLAEHCGGSCSGARAGRGITQSRLPAKPPDWLGHPERLSGQREDLRSLQVTRTPLSTLAAIGAGSLTAFGLVCEFFPV